MRKQGKAFKRWFIFAALALVAGAFPVHAASTVQGTVFLDRNGNGVPDRGEPGIPNVAVSNGKEVVATDGQGRYALPAYDEMVVFVSKPAGYTPPVNANSQPQFFYVHQPAGSPAAIQEFPGMPPTGPLPNPLNFPLLKTEEKQKFTALIMGDTQTYTDQEIGYLRDTVVRDAAGTDAVVAIAMGDNIGDKLSLYPRYLSVLGGMGMPFYLVPGNHDMNFDAPDDAHSFDTFKRYNGPAYYSFDYGKVHFVVLDSVMYLGNRRYRGEIDARQMEWLRNDLALVPMDRLIVLNMHIPIVSYTDRSSTVHQVANREELYTLLQGRRVVSLGGHTHTLEHFLPGEEEEGWGQPTPIPQIIVGAACGSWWTGDFDADGVPFSYQRLGAPRGFMLFRFDGNEYADAFKATGMAPDRQMSLSFLTYSFTQWYGELIDWMNSDPSTRPAQPPVNINDLPDQGSLTRAELMMGVPVIANVWNGSKDSTVTCRFDDGSPVVALRTKDLMDPFALRIQSSALRLSIGMSIFGQEFGPAYPQPLDQWLHTRTSTHIWTCETPRDFAPGVHRVTIQAVDIHGKSYADSKVFEVVE